jgi:hypothetical protein
VLRSNGNRQNSRGTGRFGTGFANRTKIIPPAERLRAEVAKIREARKELQDRDQSPDDPARYNYGDSVPVGFHK